MLRLTATVSLRVMLRHANDGHTHVLALPPPRPTTRHHGGPSPAIEGRGTPGLGSP